ncbi:hypothetical protein D3C86_1491130 [compost metagenome]
MSPLGQPEVPLQQHLMGRLWHYAGQGLDIRQVGAGYRRIFQSEILRRQRHR